MAFDSAPSSHITGWAEDGTDITVPISTFTELTAAEADGATGDIRKVYFALCSQASTNFAGLATDDTPAKMTIKKRSSFMSDGTAKHTFSFEFITEISGQELADE